MGGVGLFFFFLLQTDLWIVPCHTNLTLEVRYNSVNRDPLNRASISEPAYLSRRAGLVSFELFHLNKA